MGNRRRLRLCLCIARDALASVAVLLVALLFLVAVRPAFADNCNTTYSERTQFTTACKNMATSCANNVNYSCGTGQCTYSNVAYPSCWIKYSSAAPPTHTGFNGTCPTGDGPNVDWETDTEGENPPNQFCHFGCQLQAKPGPNPCTIVEGPGIYQKGCLIQTTYGGDGAGGRCTQTPGNPGSENEPPDPKHCESGANGSTVCVSPDDGDGNPSSTSSNPQPQICMTVNGGTRVCRPIPPNPAHQPGCSVAGGGALCTGGAGGNPEPPRPPTPPYPAGQQPDMSGETQAGPPPQISIPWDAYGPPGTPDPGPPNPNGACRGGAQNVQGTCVCPANTNWNGSNCVGDEGDGERSAGKGDCVMEPPCSGDQIDCSVVYQTWVTRCALESSQQAPGVDLTSDPLQQYGGPDALFHDGDSEGWLSGLDQSGFLGTSACPTMEPIQVFDRVITLDPIWCELDFLGNWLIAAALLIAARILFGD